MNKYFNDKKLKTKDIVPKDYEGKTEKLNKGQKNTELATNLFKLLDNTAKDELKKKEKKKIVFNFNKKTQKKPKAKKDQTVKLVKKRPHVPLVIPLENRVKGQVSEVPVDPKKKSPKDKAKLVKQTQRVVPIAMRKSMAGKKTTTPKPVVAKKTKAKVDTKKWEKALKDVKIKTVKPKKAVGKDIGLIRPIVDSVKDTVKKTAKPTSKPIIKPEPPVKKGGAGFFRTVIPKKIEAVVKHTKKSTPKIAVMRPILEKLKDTVKKTAKHTKKSTPKAKKTVKKSESKPKSKLDKKTQAKRVVNKAHKIVKKAKKATKNLERLGTSSVHLVRSIALMADVKAKQAQKQ